MTGMLYYGKDGLRPAGHFCFAEFFMYRKSRSQQLSHIELKGLQSYTNIFIYKINTDSGITLYPIRFWYSYEADMIFSVAYNMHFYKNTKFQSPYLERKQDMMIEVPSDYDNSSYDAYRLK